MQPFFNAIFFTFKCNEIGKDVVALLVNESNDVSKNEQMATILRYVDSLGIVKE